MQKRMNYFQKFHLHRRAMTHCWTLVKITAQLIFTENTSTRGRPQSAPHNSSSLFFLLPPARMFISKKDTSKTPQ